MPSAELLTPGGDFLAFCLWCPPIFFCLHFLESLLNKPKTRCHSRPPQLIPSPQLSLLAPLPPGLAPIPHFQVKSTLPGSRYLLGAAPHPQTQCQDHLQGATLQPQPRPVLQASVGYPQCPMLPTTWQGCSYINLLLPPHRTFTSCWSSSGREPESFHLEPLGLRLLC